MRSPALKHASKFSKLGYLTAAGVVTGGTGLWYWTTYQPGRKQSLNPITFTPWQLSSVSWLGPSTAILTLKNPSSDSGQDSWKNIWKQGIWAVQIRQPQLQIQREYSPLPPLPSTTATSTNGGGGGGGNQDEIRIFVRHIENGEVSPYLVRLAAGSALVDLRGPVLHWQFPPTKGDTATTATTTAATTAATTTEIPINVLCIVGGTGISPALQAASAMLSQNKNTKVKIVWANRTSKEKTLPDVEQWISHFGGRLTVEKYYDDVHGVIQKKVLQSAMDGIEGITESTARRGENIILVSGPDGFIEHIAGKKVWIGGRETQGPVGGLLADILSQSRDKKASFSNIIKL